MPVHYLDNAATTRVYDHAAKDAYDAMTSCYGNPSSVHLMGMHAEEIVDNARGNVSKALGCIPDEVYFTSGGTEANNWALFSGFSSVRRRGSHIITTAVEHSSVLNAAKRLESLGARVTYIPVKRSGDFDMNAFQAAFCEETVLVSVMLVNNETGALFPIRELSDFIKAKNSRAILHTDAVQGFLKVPFTVSALGADLVSVSAHKIHGPKGSGALFIRKGLNLPPLLYGGGQESGKRSGTENVPAIAGFGSACSYGFEQFKEHRQQLTALRDYAVQRIPQLNLNAVLILPENASPHILSLSLPGIPSQVLVRFLESKELFVSAGSACSRGGRSHVLEALELDPKTIDSAVRISFSHDNTKEDIDALCEALSEARKQFSL